MNLNQIALLFFDWDSLDNVTYKSYNALFSSI